MSDGGHDRQHKADDQSPQRDGRRRDQRAVLDQFDQPAKDLAGRREKARVQHAGRHQQLPDDQQDDR